MKQKLIGLSLMLVGLVVAVYLAVFIFLSKGLPVLFGCVIPYYAGRFIYHESCETVHPKGILFDAISSVKALWRRGEKVASDVSEAIKKG